MFKKIRVTILLLILLIVALNSWLDRVRSRDWQHSLRVVVYPINGDHSEAAGRYIRTLNKSTFEPIEQFFQRESQRYGIQLKNPIDIRLAPLITVLPPRLPRDNDIFTIMLWSLKMRYWAFRQDNYSGPSPEVRMFIQYFNPQSHPRLAHSVGLEKGLIGVVQAFASRKMAGKNNVIIAHELLHTVGATDKYDRQNNQPLYPDGFAAPDRQPPYPQRLAEIMSGRIPITPTRAIMPAGLQQVVVGPLTAAEINWTGPVKK